jgi:hypothetical protein
MLMIGTISKALLAFVFHRDRQPVGATHSDRSGPAAQHLRLGGVGRDQRRRVVPGVAEVEQPVQVQGGVMFTLVWLKDAGERAVKTFAQSVLAILTVGGVDVLHLNWAQTLSVAATATLISVLTSVVSVGVGNSGTASLTNAVEPAP